MVSGMDWRLQNGRRVEYRLVAFFPVTGVTPVTRACAEDGIENRFQKLPTYDGFLSYRFDRFASRYHRRQNMMLSRLC
jgi:hypothetical protein